MAQRSAEKLMKRPNGKSLKRAGLLLAAVLLAAVPETAVLAGGETQLQMQEEVQEEPQEVQEAAPGETAEEESLSSGLQKEKEYLLQALDQLETMGLSPIGIWADLSGNRAVTQQLESVKEAVAETVNQKVQEAGDAATDAVTDAIQKETDKIQESVIQILQDRVHEFLENLFSGVGK